MPNTVERPDSGVPSTDIVLRLSQFREEKKVQVWQGTFADYFGLAVQKPAMTRLSHGRVYDMIIAGGVIDGPTESSPKKYGFFNDEIFGLDQSITQIVDYFSAAAKRLEVRKRILLLMGPVGGGKSTMVTIIKRGLETYSQSDQGAVYAIEGCPMNEEPLHLIPDSMRSAVQKEYGLHIEGGLCPHCQAMLVNKYAGKVEDVMVKRITFSEAERRGVGTFTPSDPKSQDISELTGSIDLATIGEYGAESDPRAYRFDGELNIANRGVMEFIEILKCDEKFLYNLLTLSQEQNIKTGRFAMIYADEVIVSHTNESEYLSFVNNKKTEALKDRLIVVSVQYNLRLSDEVKIYDKLLKASTLELGVNAQAGQVHVAPNTLRTAATFAILSRLEASTKTGMSLMKKLRLYDGQDVEEFTSKDVKELRDQAKREGMDGVSPRFITNALSTAIARPGTVCLNPIDALRALKAGVEQDSRYDEKKKKELLEFLAEARVEYDEQAKKEVQKAFVYSFEDNAKTLLENYIDNIEAFCNKTKLTDPITDEELEPDEILMHSIEDQIGVSENGKKAFREEIMIRMSSVTRRGQSFQYNSHERLREAIERKLFVDLKDVVKITTSTKTPDADQQKRFNEVADRLVTAEHGYCTHCANELLKYVGTLINR